MLRILLLFVICCFSVISFGQPVYVLGDSSSARIENYAVLPDRGYTINRIVADSTLHFEANGALNPSSESGYWIRIKIRNPFHYAERYNIWLFPYLNNTLYYFDRNSKKWEASKSGGVDWVVILVGWHGWSGLLEACAKHAKSLLAGS